jgi:hypothetical protein
MYEHMYISETATYQFVFLGNPRKFIYTPLQQPRQGGPPKGTTAATVYLDVNYFCNNSVSSVKQLWYGANISALPGVELKFCPWFLLYKY